MADKQRIYSAEELFTDREAPREVVRKVYRALRPDQWEVINFYGIEGNGKTALLHEIFKEYCVKKKRSEQYVFYYNFERERDIPEILFEWVIRIQAQNKKISFPLFIHAYMEYKKRQGVSAGDVKKQFEHSIVESKGYEAIMAMAGDVLPGMNTISFMLNHSLSLFQKLYSDSQKKHGANKEIYESIEKSNLDVLREEMPKYFAMDANRCFKELDRPFMMLIDGYDVLVSKLKDGYSAKSNDMWLRTKEGGLIPNINNVVWVIAGREQMDWSESILPKENRHLLSSLEKKDSDTFFKKVGITSQELLDDLYKLSQGVPIYMDLCVKTYGYLKKRGVADGNISIGDFGEDTESLAKRYLLGMSAEQQEQIFIISCLPNMWDDEMVEGVTRYLGYDFIKTQYKILKQLTLVDKYEADPYCSLHEVFRKVIIDYHQYEERRENFNGIWHYLIQTARGLFFYDNRMYKYLNDIVTFLEERGEYLSISEEDIEAITEIVVEYSRSMNWEHCIRLLQRILYYAEKNHMSEAMEIHLRTWLAYYYLYHGNQREANECIFSCIPFYEKKGDFCDTVAFYNMQYVAACVLFEAEQYRRALIYAEGAVSGMEKIRGKSTKHYLRTLNAYASSYRKVEGILILCRIAIKRHII